MVLDLVAGVVKAVFRLLGADTVPWIHGRQRDRSGDATEEILVYLVWEGVRATPKIAMRLLKSRENGMVRR
jgi:hypothetical protein